MIATKRVRVKPDMEEQAQQVVVLCRTDSGQRWTIDKVSEWGRRRLAYEVRNMGRVLLLVLHC